ncbi:MAG: mechanosensitive ion channel family protein [Gemmatimonadales bacterium]
MLLTLLQAQAADSTAQGVVGTVGRWLDISAGDLVEVALRVVFVWFLVWLVIRVVRMIAARIVASVDDGDEANLSAREKRGQTAAQLVRSVGGVTAVIFGIIATLNLFIDIRPILAGAGILGLAISFGSQSLVKDIISGFFILVEDQFVVGDVIEAAGRTGTVERVTLRVVTLRDLRGVVHMIPNGQLTAVSNLTRSWSRAVVDIGVAYETSVDRALEVFREEANALWDDPAWKPKLLGAPDVVGVDELGDSGVILRTMVRTQPGRQWECAREFRRRIKNRLDQEGIEIPFPQRTVHIRQAKDADEQETTAS